MDRVDDQFWLVTRDEVPALLGDEETGIRDQRGEVLLQWESHRLQGGSGRKEHALCERGGLLRERSRG
ncbi:MAG: hypothetical protein M3Q50_00755, partial [Chloroflexota bacterium]|nr:hypothetical protein [Chloroflexota bacterium]